MSYNSRLYYTKKHNASLKVAAVSGALLFTVRIQDMRGWPTSVKLLAARVIPLPKTNEFDGYVHGGML